MKFGTDIHASLRMDFHHFGHPLTSCFGGKCHLMQPSRIQLMYEVSDILEAVKRIINVSGGSSIIKNLNGVHGRRYKSSNDIGPNDSLKYLRMSHFDIVQAKLLSYSHISM